MSRCRTRRPSLSLSASSGKRTLPSNELSTSNDSLWYVMCKSYRRQDEQLLVFSEYKCTRVLLCWNFLLVLEKLYMVLTTLSTKLIMLCVWLCLQSCTAVCVFVSACVYVIVNLSSLFSKEVAPPPYGVVALPPQYLGHLAEPQPWNCYCLTQCISFVCVCLWVFVFFMVFCKTLHFRRLKMLLATPMQKLIPATQRYDGVRRWRAHQTQHCHSEHKEKSFEMG